MIEIELKAVVTDPDGVVQRLRSAGAVEEFHGLLLDRRMDYPDRSLLARDQVVRVRVYRKNDGTSQASFEWKGPQATVDGYKQREEIGVDVDDSATLMTIVRHMGLLVTRAIDREIHQFTIEGATVRLEHYLQMDDLVEVEGDPAAIERAIIVTGIPRSEFSAERLSAFALRYMARTGLAAITGPAADIPDDPNA